MEDDEAENLLLSDEIWRPPLQCMYSNILSCLAEKESQLIARNQKLLKHKLEMLHWFIVQTDGKSDEDWGVAH
eukprot:2024635-Ditylum_brightwellii.AAC.1